MDRSNRRRLLGAAVVMCMAAAPHAVARLHGEGLPRIARGGGHGCEASGVCVASPASRGSVYAYVWTRDGEGADGAPAAVRATSLAEVDAEPARSVSSRL